MKTIALSIEQMKHLESLGLDISDASMFYNNIAELDNYIPLVALGEGSLPLRELINEYGKKYIIPAYTLQDILNHFHHYDLHRVDGTKYRLHCFINGLVEHSISGHNDFEVAYKMLLWYIENNYIETSKV